MSKKKKASGNWYHHLKNQVKCVEDNKELEILRGRIDSACYSGNITITEMLKLHDHLKEKEMLWSH